MENESVGPELAEIERALTLLFRWGNLPRVRHRFAIAAGVSLDRAAYGILAHLQDLGPLRLSDLAERIGVEISTASRQVCQLEEQALVSRTPDPDDRRAALLALTSQGAGVLNKARGARRAVLTELVSGWSPNERRQLGKLLLRLANDLISWGQG